MLKCMQMMYCFIATTVRTEEDSHTLQADLNSLEQRAKKWNMVFNKSMNFLEYQINLTMQCINTLLYSRKRIKLNRLLHQNILVQQLMNISHDVKTVISKANKVKGFLQRNINYCPSIVKARCYNSMIRPILEYASVILSPYTQKN